MFARPPSPLRRWGMYIAMAAIWMLCAAQFLLYGPAQVPGRYDIRVHPDADRFGADSLSSVVHDTHRHATATAKGHSVPYPTWVHGHVVQLHWSQQSDAKIRRIVEAYKRNKIPIDVVVFDVLWWGESTNDNGSADDVYVFDSRRFAEKGRAIIDYLHMNGIRVIVWWSSLVPTRAAATYSALDRVGAFIQDSKTSKTFVGTWQHSDAAPTEGSLLDLTSPAGEKYGKDTLRYLIHDLGVDGIRNGGVDALLFSQRDGVVTHKGHMHREDYAHHYYWFTLDYGRELRGFEFATMTKGVDTYGRFVFAQYAPVDASLLQWVGEHRGNEEGFRSALMNVFHSAQLSYLNTGAVVCGTYYASAVGCSVSNLWSRWVRASAGMPALVTVAVDDVGMIPQENRDALRWAVETHHSLRPYFTSVLSALQRTHNSADTLYSRVSDHLHLAHVNTPVVFSEPELWEYFIGDALLISPAVAFDTQVNANVSSYAEYGRYPLHLYDGARYWPSRDHTLWVRIGSVVPVLADGDVLVLTLYGLPAGSVARRRVQSMTSVLDVVAMFDAATFTLTYGIRAATVIPKTKPIVLDVWGPASRACKAVVDEVSIKKVSDNPDELLSETTRAVVRGGVGATDDGVAKLALESGPRGCRVMVVVPHSVLRDHVVPTFGEEKNSDSSPESFAFSFKLSI
eukprot:PhM_4_TR14219/c0_g1_i1/m.15199